MMSTVPARAQQKHYGPREARRVDVWMGETKEPLNLHDEHIVRRAVVFACDAVNLHALFGSGSPVM